MELVYDSDVNVKVSAIELVFNSRNSLSSENVRARITSLFVELLGSVNEEVIKKVSFLSGEILYNLSQNITNNPTYLNSLLSHFKVIFIYKIKNDLQ